MQTVITQNEVDAIAENVIASLLSAFTVLLAQNGVSLETIMKNYEGIYDFANYVSMDIEENIYKILNITEVVE